MDWNKAILYGQLVSAAYDVFAGKPPVTPGYDVLATIFANDLATNASRARRDPVASVSMGLVLQSQGSGEAVVALRGTIGIKEWLQDGKFSTEAFTRVPAAGQTEDGFTDMYCSMTLGAGAAAPSLVRALPTIPWRRPATSFTVCGHSLGGALATLLALDAAVNSLAPFNTPAVYTYASPKTGDKAFCETYSQRVATTFRIVDNADVVPQLPPGAYDDVAPAIPLKSLTIFPLRLRLQPNPVCWHVLPSYLYLMSLAAGGAVLPPDDLCATSRFLKDLLRHLYEDLRSIEKLAPEFANSPRTALGGR